MHINNVKERKTLIVRFSQLTENHGYSLAGTLLIVLYLTQLTFNLRWNWLDNLQSGEVYQQFTGFLLLTYVLMQGRLGLHRFRKQSIKYQTLLEQHKSQGILGPIIFYIHSIDIGFAYQTVLVVVFLANIMVGYLNPQSIAIRNKLYTMSWTILHVGLAMLTLSLMIFHIYIVYYYS